MIWQSVPARENDLIRCSLTVVVLGVQDGVVGVCRSSSLYWNMESKSTKTTVFQRLRAVSCIVIAVFYSCILQAH